MIFNSFNFLCIFPLLFLLYYAIPTRYNKSRNIFLIAVSYLLYFQWGPFYALVLLYVTLVTYFTALLIGKCSKRKRVLTIGILLAIFPLIFFKYADFINENIQVVFSFLGINIHLPGLNWAIPLGISFFTFQALSYVWDIYYKRYRTEHDFLSYALYISFFPCIVSGPINRASLVIPQIHAIRPYFDYPKAIKGLKLLLWGMVMKIAIADRLALYVDVVFDNYAQYSGMTCLVASFFYTIQIYADFAGYSLMAIGVGNVLGFNLTENFRRPYFAFSITDFWHRWHISLSTWLRDYVYIPLGGSRHGKKKTYRNILFTFLVSGIWHGANWTFITWGIIHGICQIIEKALNIQKHSKTAIVHYSRIIFTFIVVDIAWLFFRMPTMKDACAIIGQIFDFTQAFRVYTPGDFSIFYMLIAVVLLFIKDFTDEFFPNRFQVYDNNNRAIRWCGYITTLLYILICGVFGADQFIYANF